MSEIYTFSFPTTIHFGPGASTGVSKCLQSNQCKRPFVVTDRGVAVQKFFQSFITKLSSSGLQTEVFSGVFGNPVKSQVLDGVQKYHSHRADSIVAIGGGAAIDVAKAIALLARHSGDLFDYEDGKPNSKPIEDKIPFWVALPTTSGTGSEVGRSTVISDDKTHVKKIIFSPRLLARAVFADPELTIDLPANITAATGMDALTHCVESYLAKGYHPICDGIALEGLRLAAENLEACVRNPADLSARGAMMMASIMGAIAFQKGLGVTHSCAHALSTVADLHHGLANGIMIDHALRVNIQAVPKRFETLAKTVGLSNLEPEAFLEWLKDLKTKIAIPLTLSQTSVAKAKIAELVRVAVADGCHQCNPRTCSQVDIEQIFERAFA